VPQPATTAPEDVNQNPYVQLGGGCLAGFSIGLVPFGGTGRQLLDDARLLPRGTPNARLGLAIGEIVGGIALTVGGAPAAEGRATVVPGPNGFVTAYPIP